MLALILISSAVMTLEDIWFETRPLLMDLLYYLDRILTVVFFLETDLKLFAMGCVMYFGNAWCWLDFVIVAVSLINFGASLLGAGNIPIFKTMRTLRALRPLRAMAKMEGMKVVVNALVGALPSIFNVLIVCLIFWLIFAIIGVNTFMGRFSKCLDTVSGHKFSHEIIPNRTVCANETNAEWINAKVTFDNVMIAYLALFQVATFKGWIDIMNDAIDSVNRNDQPHREVNIYSYLFFVFFILFGSFFTLNLLVGVIIDKFNEQKNKGGSSLDAFMTEDQKKCQQRVRQPGQARSQEIVKNTESEHEENTLRSRMRRKSIIFNNAFGKQLKSSLKRTPTQMMRTKVVVETRFLNHSSLQFRVRPLTSQDCAVPCMV